MAEQTLTLRRPWREIHVAFDDVLSKSMITGRAPSYTRHHAITQEFARGRLSEGRQVAEFFLNRGLGGKVLDVGAGNGGAAIAFANFAAYEVIAIDIIPNSDVRTLRTTAGLPQHQVVGDAQALPFATNQFDVVLCLDTIEHVRRPDLLGSEIVRVLRPGGVCMLTTPPKRRYWLRPDPHYGIPGLLLLNDKWQRRIGTVLLNSGTYDVTHIFSHTDEIMRYFPGVETEILWNHEFTLATRFDRAWYKRRHYFWDRIVLTKRLA